MSVVVIYYSKFGHNKIVAEHIVKGSGAELIAISQEGTLSKKNWDSLDQAEAIILGSPTYMGNVAWQFQKFSEQTSERWSQLKWKDKLFAGFSVSSGLNGDKQATLQSMHTLASQHAGIWISLGFLPSSLLKSTRHDVNSLGASLGLFVQCPTDAGPELIPDGDLKTAELFGARVAQIAQKFHKN